MLRAADHLVEIGPGAGERGGNVVFQGTPKELIRDPVTATGGYLTGERYQPQHVHLAPRNKVGYDSPEHADIICKI